MRIKSGSLCPTDVLTIRSLRERYNNYSTQGESLLHNLHLDPALLIKQEELELLVRDFTIDDSISDCFADSDVDAINAIGVDCKPSSKVSPNIITIQIAY